MYIKIASIIEMLLGLAIAGLGVLAFLLSKVAPGPTAIIGFVLGVPAILLGILLIIFGINLGKLKRWAWIASMVILVIVIAFFVFLIIGFRAYSQPFLIFPCVGAIICLILLVLGTRKFFPTFPKISIPKIGKKKTVIILITLIVIAGGILGYFLYEANKPAEKQSPIIEDEITGYNRPQVITLNPPEVIETNSITLRAKILDSGGVDIDDVSWEFECGRAPGVYTEKLKYLSGSATGKIPQEYSRKVVNLSIATTYYCRAKSCNSAGCGYGKEIFFQTGPYYEERGGNVDTAKKIVIVGDKNINISNDTEMYCFDDLRECSLNEICWEEICGPYLFALTVQYYVEDSNYYAHKLIYAPQ